MTAPYQVTAIKAFNDNYIWAIHQDQNDKCVIVDPGSANKVLEFLTNNKLSLDAILITHHHHDHVGGVNALQAHFPNTPVYGPSKEARDTVTHPLTEGEVIDITAFEMTLKVLDVPGHTLGHIAYFDESSLFCGDTLFSAGCGRMFEGTPKMFSNSLTKLAALPIDTFVYCAHEYTLSNLNFAQAVSPNSIELKQYIASCEEKRSSGLPTIPSSIGIELSVNPFLRVNKPEVIESLNNKFAIHLNAQSNLDQNFKWLRQWKDSF
ncbi:hydroxyacylglutathione hydrolase [Psychrobium sp. nBUS_13]|uniref:hydroxyacylglutathione hydrolase n=1 Tax=Psychrobium sp. nBUS_13 TaxID=3395319 RepID=UPI003EBDA4EB